MSGSELAQAISGGGAHRVDASAFSVGDLANAADTARRNGAKLILFNHARMRLDDIRRIAAAGERRVIFDDVRLV